MPLVKGKESQEGRMNMIRYTPDLRHVKAKSEL
jgi:hypothetical protein